MFQGHIQILWVNTKLLSQFQFIVIVVSIHFISFRGREYGCPETFHLSIFVLLFGTSLFQDLYLLLFFSESFILSFIQKSVKFAFFSRYLTPVTSRLQRQRLGVLFCCRQVTPLELWEGEGLEPLETVLRNRVNTWIIYCSSKKDQEYFCRMW